MENYLTGYRQSFYLFEQQVLPKFYRMVETPLTIRELIILEVVFQLQKQDANYPSEIIKRTRQSKSAFSNMVKKMESKGYISRHRDESDHRIFRVILNEAARLYLRSADQFVDEVRMLLRRELGLLKLQQLVSTVVKLSNHLSPNSMDFNILRVDKYEMYFQKAINQLYIVISEIENQLLTLYKNRFTLRDFIILQSVSCEGINTLTKLDEYLHYNINTIYLSIRKLQKATLITTSKLASDQRIKEINLTSLGVKYLQDFVLTRTRITDAIRTVDHHNIIFETLRIIAR